MDRVFVPPVMMMLIMMFATLSSSLVSAEVASCGTPPQCRTFAQIYGNGEAMCNTIFGSSFEYERNESEAYAMWWSYGSNPNTAVTASLEELSHVKDEDKDVCHLAGDVTSHHQTPQFNQSLNECRPWSKGPACCAPSTTQSTDQLRLLYGSEWSWDRCGPMSAECSRFFAAEACFYECEPALGHFRKFPVSRNSSSTKLNFSLYTKTCDEYDPEYNKSKCDNGVNHWEVYKMPIKASYCDSWYSACANDLFCGDGDFFACAAKYEACDEQEQEQLERELNDTKAKLKLLEENITNTNSSLDTDSGPTSDESNALGTGLIVGVSVAAVVAVVAIVGLAVLVTRERKGYPVFSPLDNEEATAKNYDSPLEG